MKQESQEQLAAELIQIENALKQPDPRPEVADRVFSLMRISFGAGAKSDAASFVLGQVFEQLRPMRERMAMLARKEQIKKALERLATRLDE